MRMENGMRILVKALGFNPGDALRRHAARRLQATLANWAGRMGQVVVRILDINGPRGGTDKTCSVLLSAPRRAPVLVTAVTGDYYSAVDLAAQKAGRVASRLFRRPRPEREEL